MTVFSRVVSPRYLITLLFLTPLLAQLAACSGDGFVRERRVDYRQSRTVARLDIPPDLTQVEARGGGDLAPSNGLGTATYSSFSNALGNEVTKAGSSVLQRPDSVHVEQDGAHRWLVVDQPPEKVWPLVREFWLNQGFLIKREDPRLGIIETDWAENRADIPQGFIRRWFGKVFDFAYSAPTRDKYRVRLERGTQPGTTEIFLTQWGVEQVATGRNGEFTVSENIVWKPRPTDPELEAEFLNRLIVYLGVGEKQATKQLTATAKPAAPRARLVKGPDGSEVLHVDENIDRAWRLTGIALDHLGFVVEDRDQHQGTYVVRSADPLTETTQKKGFFAKLAFWRADQQEMLKKVRFLVSLTEAGDNTQVSVSAEQDKSPVVTQAADKILALLEEQLR